MSARPEELSSSKDLSENPIHQEMISIGGKGLRDALLGKVSANADFSETARFTAYGQEKVNDYVGFMEDKQDEDNCAVFVGDNGQGDVAAGIDMMEKSARMAGLFDMLSRCVMCFSNDFVVSKLYLFMLLFAKMKTTTMFSPRFDRTRAKTTAFSTLRRLSALLCKLIVQN